MTMSFGAKNGRIWRRFSTLPPFWAPTHKQVQVIEIKEI
jgi:hypothetical protein